MKSFDFERFNISRHLCREASAGSAENVPGLNIVPKSRVPAPLSSSSSFVVFNYYCTAELGLGGAGGCTVETFFILYSALTSTNKVERMVTKPFVSRSFWKETPKEVIAL